VTPYPSGEYGRAIAPHCNVEQTVSCRHQHVNEAKVIEPQPKDLRNHPRIFAPKELVVVWRSGDQRGASCLGTVGLGGVFLKTPKPPAAGSAVELVIQVSPGTPGTDVRARAVVYNVKPGEGMGVKFVQMRGDDRLRLNQFLQTQFKRLKSALPVP
jgi:PilZ domain